MAMPAEVCAVVAGFLELAPRVPANTTNLETLLARVLRDGYYESMCGTATVAGPRIVIEVVKRGNWGWWLWLDIYEPMLLETPWVTNGTSLRMRTRHEGTPRGMRGCVDNIRATLASLSRGLCETCASAEPPRKKLKGPGFPLCLDCSVRASFGL